MKVKFKTDIYNEIKKQLDEGFLWGRIPDDKILSGFQSYSKEFLEVPFLIVKNYNDHSYLIVEPSSISGCRISKCHVINLPSIDFDLQDDLFEWSE